MATGNLPRGVRGLLGGRSETGDRVGHPIDYRGAMAGNPTLSDVARAAHVHPGTASRALNEDTRSMVSPMTVERVLAAAQRLGYTANVVARGLRRQRSQTVGVLIPDLTNPMFAPIVRGIEDALSPAGFTAFIANTDNDEIKERRAFEAFRARHVDGFIFANARRSLGIIQDAFDLGIPAVLANRVTDIALFPWVAGDDDSGMRQIIDHLADLGHRHIAYIAGPQDVSAGNVRTRAFRTYVERDGLDVRSCPVVQGEAFDSPSGNAGVRHILRHYPAVTAIVCGNDMIAVGALAALRDAGISCPDEISIVGFNDMALARDLLPSLTTVRAPLQQFGQKAAEMLLSELADSVPEKGVLLPTTLVERGSSGPARQHDLRPSD